MVAHRCPPENPEGPGWCWHQCRGPRVRRIIRATMEHTVLIVDDHAEFRASARALLEADGFMVVGEAADGAGAIAAAGMLHPTIVLLDIALPDTDGFAVADTLACHDAPPAVILTSSRERSAYGRRIDGSLVRGFVPKRALSGASIRALLP